MHHISVSVCVHTALGPASKRLGGSMWSEGCCAEGTTFSCGSALLKNYKWNALLTES